MRIPSGVTDQVIYFVAVDATDFTTRETGLSTWTVYRSRNGGTATAMTTPTISELSAANMPGVYSLLLDEDMTIGTGNDSEEMVFHITHTGMAPVTRTIELYRPKITAGNTLTVASDGDLTEVNTLTGHTAQTGDNYARLGAPAGASVSADIATVDSNVDAILVDTGTTLDGKLNTIDDFLDTEIAAILEDTGTTIPAQITALNDPTAATIAAAVWNALQASHVTPGSFGEIATEIAAILDDTDLIDDGTSGLAKIATDVAAILVDTGTTLDGKINTIDTNVDAILVDTAEIGAAGAGLTEAGGTGDHLTALATAASIAALNDLSAADVNAQMDAAFTTQMADSVPSDGTIATREQALYMLNQFMTERAVSGTTVTVKKVDGTTTLFTLTLDDGSAPTSVTRAT